MSGRLRPGARLPGSRALSEQLGVSRNTIILAYETLTAEGYLESREGAGTYVSNALPDNSLSVADSLAKNTTHTKPIHLFVPVAEEAKRSTFPNEIVYDFAPIWGQWGIDNVNMSINWGENYVLCEGMVSSGHQTRAIFVLDLNTPQGGNLATKIDIDRFDGPGGP